MPSRAVVKALVVAVSVTGLVYGATEAFAPSLAERGGCLEGRVEVVPPWVNATERPAARVSERQPAPAPRAGPNPVLPPQAAAGVVAGYQALSSTTGGSRMSGDHPLALRDVVEARRSVSELSRRAGAAGASSKMEADD
ncbi:MAG: hypothetical protein ACOC1F_10175 [Myxococcota bacterium]